MTLNRADELRRSDDEVNALWCDPGCRVVLMHKNQSLFSSLLDPVVVHQSDLAPHEINPKNKTFLGLDSDNNAWFSLQCSDAVSYTHLTLPTTPYV